MKGKWDDEGDDERRIWKENEMMKGILKGEAEMRMSWWKEWWKQKMKGE